MTTEAGVPEGRVENQRPNPREVLTRRTEILRSAIRPFAKASLELIKRFHTSADPSETSELPREETRKIYQDLLQDPACSDIVRLWFEKGTWSQDDMAGDVRMRVFGYGFNKLKTLKDGSIVMRERKGTIDRLQIPYPLHTHVEVLHFMQEYGLGKTILSKSLGALHDVTEEGKRVTINERGERSQEPVSPEGLINRFPEDQLGTQLAIGVPALTESKIEELQQRINIDEFVSNPEVQATVTIMENAFPGMGTKIQKHIDEDPLVFGGLALQVATTVDELFVERSEQFPSLATKQRQDLAKSIIEVELADRMCDMATLERFITDRKDPIQGGDTPIYARQRVLLRTARLRNMLEKLEGAIDRHGLTAHFADALAGYGELMEAKLDDVNESMKQQEAYKELPPITTEEVDTFYKEHFKPVQDVADKVLQPFITRKASGILATAGVGSSSAQA